jgi:hypothetical protein
VEPIVAEIQESYHGKAQQALIAAIRDVHQQYLIYKGQTKTPNEIAP